MATRNERTLAAIDEKLAQGAEALLALGKAAENDDRELTNDEQTKREELRAEITALKERRAAAEGQVAIDREIDTLARGLRGNDEAEKDRRIEPMSLGEQFVESAEYKRLTDNGLTGKWSSGQIELRPSAANFFEGTGASPGPAGALVPEQRLPGVMPILQPRLTVADLIASGTTSSNLIRYVVETVADGSNVGSVAEGADKPEVSLELDLTDEPVRKLAAFLPTSDEALEDGDQIRSYIDARLRLFVEQEEEDQLLNKTGSGTDLNGILNRIPAGNKNITAPAAVTAPNDADHIYAAMTQARESYLEPTGIVVNPDDWAALRMLKTSDGAYIAGTPFSNAAGGQPGDSLWGKPVVVTPAMAAGKALVGAFQSGAQVFRKGGITVEASNSHADFFRKNLTAIRAEERLALAVYRPQAFATANLA